MRLNMEITGLDKVETDVEGRARRLLNLQPAFFEIAADVRGVEERAFDTGGASTGKAWAPNAPWWAAYKRRHYPAHHGVLEMGSAKLRNSLTIANAPYSRVSVSRQAMVYGTTLGIARVLLKGGTRTIRNPKTGVENRVRIPARPFLRAKLRDRKRWAGLMQDYVAGEPGFASGGGL